MEEKIEVVSEHVRPRKQNKHNPLRITLLPKVKWMIVCAGLLVGCVGLWNIYQEMSKQEVSTTENLTYEYEFVPKVGYNVRIKPNNIYPTATMEEGKTYTMALVDEVKIYFKEQFKGSDVTKISGEYQIYIEVRGYKTTKEGKEIVWSKVYEEVPLTTIALEDTTYMLEESVTITTEAFASYHQFIDEAMKVTMMKPSTEVCVGLVGGIKGETPYGNINRKIHSKVLIPLNQETFEIQKIVDDPVQDCYKETVETPVPINEKKVMLWGSVAGVGVVMTLIILILGRSPEKEALHAYKAKKILRNYGSRMAAMQAIDETPFVYYYYMESIEDLLKVADELQKPVIYKSLRNISNINKFYVMDQQTLYTYIIDLAMDEEEE
ncbi:MAG: DUF5305 family protein [Cellulosilyticaceae bacterium]